MDRGFTIIEVLMFVSISGLIVIMVLTGFTTSIETNRRIDTNRSLEAAIEAEYTSVRSGTVVREIRADGTVPGCNAPAVGSYPGASDSCIIIGKLLKIQQGTNSRITTHNVVADIIPTNPCVHRGVRAIIVCHQARVLEISETTGVITPEWAAQISRVDFQDKSGTTYRSYGTGERAYIAMLRDPSSELVYVVPLLLPDRTIGLQSLDNGIDAEMSNYENTQGQLCLQHNGLLSPNSYLRFDGGEGIGTIGTSDDSLFGGVLTC